MSGGDHDALSKEMTRQSETPAGAPGQ